MTHEVPPSLPPDAAASAGPRPRPGRPARSGSGWPRRGPPARGRRRHRGRRRPGGLGDRLLPGPGRPGRAAAGEDRLPAGEGLRRRPDPARGQGADRDGRADRRGGRLAPQQGPADHRRRASGSSCPGRSCRATPATGWSGPGSTSTRSSPGTRRRPGARLLEGATVTGPVLDDAPGGSPASPPGRGRRDGRRAGRAPTARRSWSPRTATPPGCRWRWACASATTGRMGVAVRTYYTSPRHDDDWLESWLELWDGQRQRPAARLRLDLRRWATAPATSASAC